MKQTLETKYQSSKKNYDNVYNQYINAINNATGRDDGAKFLTDYSTAFSSSINNQGQTSSGLKYSIE